MSEINNADFTPDAPNFKKLVLMSFQGLTNFPYIEEDFDALTNYGFLSKVVEYLNQVISNNNEQNDLMTALYNAYVSLQDYVNTYFDNLDVQEEINKKLDEMAQDGSLTILIAEYVQPLIDEQNEILTNMNALVNTHTSQIANLVSHASDTGENSELIDIRVAADGDIYSSAGESVRTQIRNNKKEIIRNREVYNNHMYVESFSLSSALFELGGIISSTGATIASNNRIRTKNFITFDELIQIFKITPPGSGYIAQIYVYNSDESYINYFEFAGGTKFQNISTGHLYKLVLTNNGVDMTTDDIPDLLASYPMQIWSFYDRSNDIYDMEQLNLINPNIVNETSIINATNAYPQYAGGSNYNAGVVPIESGTTYYTNVNNFNAAFYDVNMNVISVHANSLGTALTNPFTTPINAKYMGFTVSKSGMDVSSYISKRNQFFPYGTIALTIKDSILESTRPASNDSVLKDKVIDVFGDSISSTDYTLPYWGDIIAANTGCSINNYGISGTTLAHTNDRHLYDYHFGRLDAEEIGYVPSDPSTWSTGNCFCERFTKVDTSADAIVIMGGTNDYNVPLGEWNSTNTNTFYGGLNVLLQGISENMAGKKILVCTPMQQATDFSSNVFDSLKVLGEKTSAAVVPLQLRADAIREKCEQFGITCLDLFNDSGINGIDNSHIYYRSNDNTHPSSYGQQRIASLIQSKLEDLFR